MNIAFYAPLKPPDHPVPSGDRLIARLLLEALEQAGHAPLLVSRFRSYEGLGDRARQRRLRAAGDRLARRLLRQLRGFVPEDRPRVWITYHLYHKAPDWIGPPVSRALGIPYVVIEGTVAPKQRTGRWREGYVAATEAIVGADLVVAINSSDIPCVRAVLEDPARLVQLKPFVDLATFNGSSATGGRARLASGLGISPEIPWLVTVAMMRPGNKLDSYKLLATALETSRDSAWHLLIVGDGAARAEVESTFARALSARVTFLGLRPRSEIASLLSACDLFLWPAVAEPLGMSLLEAHAAGLAVVAGDSGGVSDIVRHGETGLLTPTGNAQAFADSIECLLRDRDLLRRMGGRARARAETAHSLDAAATALDGWLEPLARGPR